MSEINEKKMNLLREDCEILTLVLTKEWFDLIASGEKKQEYRTSQDVIKQIDRWYGHAAINGKVLVVRFCLGYQKDRPEILYAAEKPFVSDRQSFTEWGEPAGTHYVIPLLYSVGVS